MAVLEYGHTRELLVDHLRLSQDSFRASLLSSNYVYRSDHTRLPQLLALSVSDIAVTLYSSNADRYRMYISNLLFPSVTGDVGGVVIYRDGTANNLDRPLLFYVSLNPASLTGSDYELLWDYPLMEW